MIRKDREDPRARRSGAVGRFLRFPVPGSGSIPTSSFSFSPLSDPEKRIDSNAFYFSRVKLSSNNTCSTSTSSSSKVKVNGSMYCRALYCKLLPS